MVIVENGDWNNSFFQINYLEFEECNEVITAKIDQNVSIK